MKRPGLVKVTAVGACCAVAGGAAGIASGIAAPNSNSNGAGTNAGHHHRGLRAGGLRGAVHADLVIPIGNGQFGQATLDRGVVEGVNGNVLTLKEGTQKAVYKTVTLTIPANARVRDNRQAATLVQVKQGQRAIVVQSPKQTAVFAHDANQG